MKIVDGLKLKGMPAEIPDTTRDDLPQFFKTSGHKVGVEIGVYKGEFTEKLCKAGLKVYGIDPYITYKNYRKHSKEIDYEIMYNGAKELEKKHDCTIIRKTSMDALEDFEDESLDFVYIDGNHSIPYITQDIYEWSRKIKSGGIVSGHDYCITGSNPYGLRVCHVKYAVDIMARIFNIENFYVLGGKFSNRIDKWRSWLWTKE